MSENKLKTVLFNIVAGKVEKYEPIFIVLILAVLALNLVDAQFVEGISVLITIALAIIFILTAYEDISEKGFTEMDPFFQKIGAFSSAMGLVGILFTLVEFPNALSLLFVGFASLLVTVVYVLAKGRIKIFGTFTVIRFAVIAAISGWFFWDLLS